jgi:hypothetical protein
VQLGGIALQDASQGLEVQTWYLDVNDSGDFLLRADSVAQTLLFTRPGTTWARLSFDQNMFPIISFVQSGQPYYYWYDPLIPAFQFVPMDVGVTFPCVTMDDKRALEIRLGTNDVILAYLRGGSLYYRQQRDRYGVEYLLAPAPSYPTPVLWKVGMTVQLRLQFKLEDISSTPPNL